MIKTLKKILHVEQIEKLRFCSTALILKSNRHTRNVTLNFSADRKPQKISENIFENIPWLCVCHEVSIGLLCHPWKNRTHNEHDFGNTRFIVNFYGGEQLLINHITFSIIINESTSWRIYMDDQKKDKILWELIPNRGKVQKFHSIHLLTLRVKKRQLSPLQFKTEICFRGEKNECVDLLIGKPQRIVRINGNCTIEKATLRRFY